MGDLSPDPPAACHSWLEAGPQLEAGKWGGFFPEGL